MSSLSLSKSDSELGPTPIFALLPQKVYTSSEVEIIETKELSKIPFFGLFFGASWCPHCHNFLGILIKEYKRINQDKKNLEIVFASLDSDLKEYTQFVKEMPWCYLPLSHHASDLQSFLDVQSIPCLIIFDNNGFVVDYSGIASIKKWGYKALDYWKEQKKKGENNEN